MTSEKTYRQAKLYFIRPLLLLAFLPLCCYSSFAQFRNYHTGPDDPDGDITHNEGNLALQRAFQLAGVRYLLVSLWDVNADATAKLLSLFYANWLKGMPLNEPLQKAQSPSYYFFLLQV